MRKLFAILSITVLMKFVIRSIQKQSLVSNYEEFQWKNFCLQSPMSELRTNVMKQELVVSSFP